MRVGLISDTHLPSLIRSLDALGPQIGEFLATCDLVLHGGDVCRPSVLDWIEQFAPVLAVRGNHDVFEDDRIAEAQVLTLAGWRIGMAHELRPETRPVREMIEQRLGGADVDVLIGGDTHVERLEHRDGVVVVNSGSPNLPHHKETRLGTVGLLDLEPGYLRAEIVVLGETPGRRNPGQSLSLTLDGRRLVDSDAAT